MLIPNCHEPESAVTISFHVKKKFGNCENVEVYFTWRFPPHRNVKKNLIVKAKGWWERFLGFWCSNNANDAELLSELWQYFNWFAAWFGNWIGGHNIKRGLIWWWDMFNMFHIYFSKIIATSCSFLTFNTFHDFLYEAWSEPQWPTSLYPIPKHKPNKYIINWGRNHSGVSSESDWYKKFPSSSPSYILQRIIMSLNWNPSSSDQTSPPLCLSISIIHITVSFRTLVLLDVITYRKNT